MRKYLSYRAAAHMLPKIDASDPPIWLQSTAEDLHPLLGDPLHHPYHARAVIDAAEVVGVDVVADVPALELTAPEDRFEFATRLLVD